MEIKIEKKRKSYHQQGDGKVELDINWAVKRKRYKHKGGFHRDEEQSHGKGSKAPRSTIVRMAVHVAWESFYMGEKFRCFVVVLKTKFSRDFSRQLQMSCSILTAQKD